MMNEDNNTPFVPEKFTDFNNRKSPSILIMGSRGSGKTTMCVDLMNKLCTEDKYDVCMIFTAKNTYNNYNLTNFSVIKLNDELNEEILKNLLHRQRILIDNNKTSKLMLIIDNVQNFEKIKNTDAYSDLILNSRCYNISIMTTTPSSTSFHPKIRTNMDYIFLLNEQSLTVKQKLYENYGGMFSSFKQFEEVFDETTRENYNSLVINNTGKTQKVMQYKEKYSFWMFKSWAK